MPPVPPGPEPALTRVRWQTATRIIASRFPTIDLFERVDADPAVWDALIAAEMLTNPRVRDEIGEIALVPPEERITGPGATWVMASFTHLNPNGSRFSDGSYEVSSPFTVTADEEGKAVGAQRSQPARAPIVRGLTKYPVAVEGLYYAGIDLATALAETIHHFERYARDSDDPIRDADMRVLVGRIDQTFHDIASLPEPARTAVLDPDDYATSRRLGRTLRETGSNGVTYPSVRHAKGRCIGAFRPRAVHPPVQERHLRYHWNGTRVSRWFDYTTDIWQPWP